MSALSTPDDRERWKAALERRGEAAVRAMLKRTGPGPDDTLPLRLRGGPNPPRALVEDWLQRKLERRMALARRRFILGVWLVVLTLVIAGAIGAVAPNILLKWLSPRLP